MHELALEGDTAHDTRIRDTRHDARIEAHGDVSGAGDVTLESLFDQYSPVVYGLAAHILGDGPAAETVVEEVFVRAWRAGVAEWAESADFRESMHEDSPGALDPAMNWLLRLTYVLAIAGFSGSTVAAQRQLSRTGGNPLPETVAAVPELGIYDAAVSPEQGSLLVRILWRGESIAQVALDTGRAPLEVAKDVRAAMTHVRSFSRAGARAKPSQRVITPGA